jgi:Cu-processing system ATP-binding protein
MQDGEVYFHKKVATLKAETNEDKISKAIASILKYKSFNQNHQEATKVMETSI